MQGHNFSRDEIETGLWDLAERYGANGIVMSVHQNNTVIFCNFYKIHGIKEIYNLHALDAAEGKEDEMNELQCYEEPVGKTTDYRNREKCLCGGGIIGCRSHHFQAGTPENRDK